MEAATAVDRLLALLGLARRAGKLALGATAVGSLFHYVMKGPNEVSKELEEEMEKEDSQ